MIEGITGSASFRCSNCGHVHSLHPEDFDFSAESGSNRSMGQETLYVSYHNQACDHCGQEIEIRFEVWEYPTGIVNHSAHEATGATDVSDSFYYQHVPDTYVVENGNNRVVGAAAGGAILGASLGGPAGALLGGIIGALLGDSVNKSGKGGK